MPDQVAFTMTCPNCGKHHIFTVDREKFARWQGGEYIQDVWPDKSEDERELMMSGVCPPCWPQWVGEE